MMANRPTVAPRAGGDAPDSGKPGSPEKMEELLNLDTLQIELGYGLLALADPKKGGDVLERVTSVRRNFVQEMGFIIPAVRLRDNLELQPNEYRFIFAANSSRPAR